MKVLKDDKVVKNANVAFDAAGNPAQVTVDGVNYDPSGYTFEDDAPKKKTRKADGDAMTTKTVKH